jgi:1L-myo-inositol 1-phosphate cytidylyltransferase / CDP-L-myo-inositol myo-inositolphosphotransferase
MSGTRSGRRPDDPGVSVSADDTLPSPQVGVVLAAGRSERLGSVTGGGSKALVRVGGVSLVERAVRCLLGLGLEEVVVVVGHEAGPVSAVVNRIAPGRVRAVLAERWEDGNGESLSAAEPILADEPLFIVVTADHVFGDGSLAPLLRAGRPAVLLDHAPEPTAWAEGTRVRLQEEHAIAFSKDLGDPSIDCGAFLLTPAVFAAQREAAARGDHGLSEAVTTFAASRPLAAIPLPTDAWWLDIDTPGDLRAAPRTMRRALAKPGDGPVSRYVNRPVSTRLSMAAAPLRIHPDVISVAASVTGLVAAWLLGTGAGIVGAILTCLTSILDGMDGEAARLQDRATPAGALLDGVLDRLTDAAIVAGLSVWAIGDGMVSPTTGVILAVAATAASLLSMATKDRIAAVGLPATPERRIGFLLGGRDGRLLLVTACALVGRPAWALVAVTATAGAALVARLLLVRARVVAGGSDGR